MTLPEGFSVRLREDACLDGSLLVGGSPFQIVNLSPRALELMVDGELRVASEASRVLADRLLELNLAVPVVSPTAAPDLTVVVPIRGRAGLLDRLLAQIEGSFPVVVVDDASDDRRPIEDVAGKHNATLISLDHNVGPAAARNIGMRQATTRLVAFVDSDITVSSSDLRLLATHFDDPKVAAVAPRVRGAVAPGGSAWFARYEEVASSLDLGPRPSGVRPWSMISWLPSACLVVRVDAAGDGFDPDLRVAEDVDFVWRLLAQGHRVRYEPAATVWHDTRGTWREWLGRKVYYGTGGDLLAARHGNLVAPAVLSPASTAAVLAMLAQRRWSGPVALACAAMTARRVHAALPSSPRKVSRSAELAATGVWATAGQFSALALRHWWPMTIPAVIVSRRARRAVAVATAVDGISAYRRQRPRLDFGRFVLARRLDDMAYGLGLWLGAAGGRSTRALRPRIVLRRR